VATIITDDLDPVYVGVQRSIKELGEKRTHRFLAAMVLYYHIGLACQIADTSTDETFWDVMFQNYEGTKRGTERRYFRGEQGLRCLNYLKATYKTPTDFLTSVYRSKYSELMKAFDPVPAFGPYFVWKVQDFFDRILGMSVEPDTCVIHLPGEPLKGMELVRSEMISLGREEFKSFTTEQMFSYMQAELNEIGLMAPPLMDRLIDIREVETAMCMLKHYHNGSDYVGKDLLDKFESLNGYGETAEIIQSNIPKPVPRDFFSPPAEVVAKLGIKLSKAGLEEPAKNLNNTTNLLAFA
jgi:hypothetical protein